MGPVLDDFPACANQLLTFKKENPCPITQRKKHALKEFAPTERRQPGFARSTGCNSVPPHRNADRALQTHKKKHGRRAFENGCEHAASCLTMFNVKDDGALSGPDQTFGLRR